ncbi:hypothetical protein [Paludisphaera mucosa]|uniref:CopG-like ribbon-helix-helix domain-containing protein n=1 Tax=Paludisphaera mucosa TaxID=3030827 RepID=A0ABT6FL89_9BACT|nr:hypothetical protein [Paludisphaera mucosa]MDG3008341.1 hypothetical protein [Paludisphaera mucosa]
MLAGVLEREKTQPKPFEPEVEEMAEAEPSPSKGRGGAASAKARAAASSAKRIKPRTIHLPDDLFERILVQSHRRGRTISEYVAALLDRHVPDHRVVRSSGSSESEDAA